MIALIRVKSTDNPKILSRKNDDKAAVTNVTPAVLIAPVKLLSIKNKITGHFPKCAYPSIIVSPVAAV